MSSLSDLFPAGAGKEVSFTASGAVANGDTVILNSNGTVTSVSGQNYAAGSQGDASTTSGDSCAGVFDSNSNKVVVSWEDSNNSYAAVGTVSGSSITFGSAVQYLTNRDANTTHMAFDSGSNRIVISYRDDGPGANNYGQVIVGSVSGSSISFGTAVTYVSGTVTEPRVVYDSTNDKTVVFFKDSTDSYRLKGIVGTVSGTSISFGSATQVESDTGVESIDACFDSNAGKTVTTYKNSTASGVAAVGTVSGTSISFGSAVTWSTKARTISTNRPTVFDSTNNKVVILFCNNDDTTTVRAIVGTVSGTSISFGTEVVSPVGPVGGALYGSHAWSAAFDPDTASVVFNVRRGADNAPSINTFKVSGTSGSFGGFFHDLSSISTNYADAQMVYDTSADKAVLTMQNYSNSSRASAFVFTVPDTNVTASNFLGVATGAISDGASGSIMIKGGVSSNVSSLTPNTVYYVQNDGSLGTTTDGTVLAGRAISATSIDLDYST